MKKGVIFDLDGVITDTAEYHYQGWKRLADELSVPFNREKKEALRGLDRMDSLSAMLGEKIDDYTEEELKAHADRKNGYYQQSIETITPDDLLPGVRELLADLKKRRISLALASSSKNARTVLGKLQLEGVFDALVDGYDLHQGKPNPEIFQIAAQRLGLLPKECVVVEDAASGVEAALGAGMKAVGMGRADMLRDAHLVVASMKELAAADLLAEE